MPITITTPSIAPQLANKSKELQDRMQKALDDAVDKLSQRILNEGRSDISGAGNFGTRWTMGFTVDVTGSGGTDRTLTFNQAVPYWHIFQTGGTIQGKPLLWIPIDDSLHLPRAGEYPGRLFRVDRKNGGAPLLLSDEGRGNLAVVRYHGQTSVRIPKKFHTVEIIRAETKTFGALFHAAMLGV